MNGQREPRQRLYLVNGKVITPYRLIDSGGVCVQGEYIDQVFSMNEVSIPPAAEQLDVQGAWIMPGLIDMHLHGGDGADVMDASVEAFHVIAAAHARNGTTSIVPTTLTGSYPLLRDVLDAFGEARKYKYLGARLLGIHLEGPYFAYEQRGAQDPRYLKNPEPEEYLELLDSYPFILRVSAAPELPGALELGRELRRRGIIAAIGHTNAYFEDVIAAVEAGYTHVTHMYSGMEGVRRVNCYRRAGTVEAALLLDDLTVEVIADGKHLPPSLLQLIYKCKGARCMALCSDALRAAGMPEGVYQMGSEDYQMIVDDGVAWLLDRSAFAGSVVAGSQLLKTMVELADVPLPDAVQMATTTPARILKVDDRLGSLDQGKYADIVVLREDFSVMYTIVGGEIVYQG
jgi:N-acetylglucosamine-6-phosphate deacetylase